MPWNETEPMTEKERFVTLSQTGRFTVGELCHDFGISRKTGHKYLKHYRSEGRDGLADRSRRPRSDTYVRATWEDGRRLRNAL